MSADDRGLQYGLVAVDSKAIDAKFVASGLITRSLENYTREHILDAMT